MIIGILSDTHGRTEAASIAIDLLQRQGAEFLVHCGDVGGTRVLDLLTARPSAFVWGNCDYDRGALERHAAKLAIRCLGSFGELLLGGRKLAVLHGDDAALKQALLRQPTYDYLLQGHTHVRQDQRIRAMRLINPGALHRANPRTVALLDTAADRLEWLTVAV